MKSAEKRNSHIPDNTHIFWTEYVGNPSPSSADGSWIVTDWSTSGILSRGRGCELSEIYNSLPETPSSRTLFMQRQVPEVDQSVTI